MRFKRSQIASIAESLAIACALQKLVNCGNSRDDDSIHNSSNDKKCVSGSVDYQRMRNSSDCMFLGSWADDLLICNPSACKLLGRLR